MTVPPGTHQLRVDARGRAGGAHGVPRPTAAHRGPCRSGARRPRHRPRRRDRLVVRLDRPADGLRLRGPGTDLAGEARGRRHGRLRHPARPLRPRRSGSRRRSTTCTAPGVSALAATWRDRLPVEVVGDRHRLRVLPGGGGPGELHLGPPRARRRAGRLRPGAAARGVRRRRAADRPGPLVLRELRRSLRHRHPAGRLRGAAPPSPGAGRRSGGSSTTATGRPPGRAPVVIGSREWYDVLGTARVLVTNTELEEWYRRRPDQLVVQCFHGYPSKAMGRVPVGGSRAAAAPGRGDAAAQRRDLGPDLDADPGDDGGLPRAVRLHRPGRRARLPPQRRAAAGPTPTRVRATARGAARRTPGPDGGALRADLARPPRHPAAGARRCRSTSTWTPPRPRWATPTCSCCAGTASTRRAVAARASST